MPLSEVVRLSLFVSAVVAVNAGALILAARWTLRRLRPAVPGPTTRETLLCRAIFPLTGLGLLCFAYGYFIEPYWPEVTHVRIKSAKLAKGARPIRIVQISDLHSDPKSRLEDRLPPIIAAERPDLIAYTGDSINSPQGLPIFQRCLKNLAAIAPTFAVRGNWDQNEWKSIDLFRNTGASELNGNAMKVNAAGTELWIAGVAAGEEWKIGETLRQVPHGAFTVFLDHFPHAIYPAAQQKVDLFLAGHTHGGQVALPIYGALITNSKLGKQFEAGLYRVDETWLYVNRGIGMEGDGAPRVRFCARPEVTVIEIWPVR